jgi:hypothetical protein
VAGFDAPHDRQTAMPSSLGQRVSGLALPGASGEA